MKKQVSILIPLIALIILGLIMSTGTMTFAQKKKSTIKIGTYDSRIAIFAWSRSDNMNKYVMKFKQQGDSAEKARDTTRLKEISIEAISFQHLLHLMVFSNGSAASFMEIIKNKLPDLAKKEGVMIIVSKWELNYSDPSFEIVDLTKQVAALFEPKETIDKMAADIAGQAPVPIQEFGIEAEMIDGYCNRFGKK
ncbi:MAG: hypothetical protein WCI71_08775 [Bacteroidota bacterium]